MQSITREASCIWGLDFFLLGLAEDFLMVGVFLGDGVDDKEWWEDEELDGEGDENDRESELLSPVE